MRDPDARERFWMVARQPRGPRARTEPKMRYATWEAAAEDAAELARTNGHPYVILEVRDVVEPGDDPGAGRLL